jgi:hypothetical protein
MFRSDHGYSFLRIALTRYFIAASVVAGKTSVAQVSQPAVSPISKSAGRRTGEAFAGLETCDTADSEVRATGLPVKYPG